MVWVRRRLIEPRPRGDDQRFSTRARLGLDLSETVIAPGNIHSSSGDEAAQPAKERRYGVVTRAQRELALATDIVLGVLVQARDRALFLGRPLQLVARPAARVVLRPPLVPRRLQPGTWLRSAAERGSTYRRETQHDLDAVLDRLLPAVLTQMMRHVDVAELLQDNVDVVALVEEVMAEIDLPEIIRESTGAMASDTLLGVRMHSISGDDALARAVGRLRLRLGRGAVGPGGAEPLPPVDETVLVVSPGTDPLDGKR